MIRLGRLHDSNTCAKSLGDVLLAAGPNKPVRDEEVVATLQGICGHHPVPHVVTA